MPEKFKSRKFWYAFIGALMPIVGQLLTDQIDPSTAIHLTTGVICTYLLSQGYEDGKGKEGAAKKLEREEG